MEKPIIDKSLFIDYKNRQRYSLAKHVKKLRKLDDGSYKFAFTRSSIFSSMIEGSTIDLDNYLFNKANEYVDEGMLQIDDLIKAYEFAKTHALTLNNVFKVHEILSKNFRISDKYKGSIRDREVYIRSWYGKILYEGCPTNKVKKELESLFLEIDQLKRNRAKLTIDEAFFYASYIHLVFVNIHPFADGNGRISRLIEKWVLVSLTENQNCWKIPSEINYWIKREDYHATLNQIGKKYGSLDYSKSLSFLLLLPTSFGISKKFTE